MVKKSMPSRRRGSALLPAQTLRRQDAFFHRQGRSRVDAQIVLTAPERKRRKERQVCDPEGSNMARTPLAAFYNIPL
ncbi:MAG: hypothetical protein VST68_12115 [Nitrospirota bacterium]|nr:hypothetical protein [Nitrospirota bacterium]